MLFLEFGVPGTDRTHNTFTSYPGGGEIFRTRPDGPWGPPSFLHGGYRVSCPGVKRPARGVNHPPCFTAEVKDVV